MPKVVCGDLLNADERVVCHQTNATSRSACGLARQLFHRYPYADTYRTRTAPSVPGTNDYMHPPQSGSFVVVNMNAQLRPGRPSASDTGDRRLRWFEACLHRLGQWCRAREILQVAMPHGIGCGLAGGEWKRYEAALERFEATHRVSITLYRLSS